MSAYFEHKGNVKPVLVSGSVAMHVFTCSCDCHRVLDRCKQTEMLLACAERSPKNMNITFHYSSPN